MQVLYHSQKLNNQVITGGIEARYGDVTGGLISLTTKGPLLNSPTFWNNLRVDWPLWYNLFVGNISGPILKNKHPDSPTRISLSVIKVRDDRDPPAFGEYRATEKLLQILLTTRFLCKHSPVLLLNNWSQWCQVVKGQAIWVTSEWYYGKLDFRISVQ